MDQIKIVVADSNQLKKEKILSDIYVYLNIDEYNFEESSLESHFKYGFLKCLFYAWKEVDAEHKGVYLGNEFFTFSEKCHNDKEKNLFLDSSSIEKYRLDSKSLMRSMVSERDGIVSCPEKMNEPVKSRIRNHIWSLEKRKIDEEVLNSCIEAVKTLYPNEGEFIEEYINGMEYYSGYSFILRSALFDKLAEYVFSVLRVLSNKYVTETSSIVKNNSIEEVGYLLIEAYLYKLMKEQKSCLIEANTIEFLNVSEEEEIYPAFEENNVSILIVSSEYYMPYATTCINSIIENMSEEYNYDILVMQSSLSDESKQILFEMHEHIPNLSIRCVDLKRNLTKFNLSVNERITKDIFYRTVAPFVLKQYSKMVVLDTDLVVNKDIAELYNTDLEGYSVGATRDLVILGFLNGDNLNERKYYLEECVLSNPYNYINTGVMVQDYTSIREKYECDSFMSYFQEQCFHVQEQDCMNKLLDGDIKFIDIHWNVNGYNYSRKKFSIEKSPQAYYLEYLEARKNPWIMHWPGTVKPWTKPDVDMARIFWKYARTSPMYEIILMRIYEGKIADAVKKPK